MSPAKPNSQQLMHRTRAQLGLLVFQFLLGMAVNLIGDPKDLTSNFAKFADRSILVLHIVAALGLIVGAIMLNRLAKSSGAQAVKLAGGGAAAIGAAFICGIATLSAPFGEFWSYLMAVAFIAAFILYGKLYLLAKAN